MDRIAAPCSTLTTAHIVFEWVPITDSKFHELVRGREAIYAHINESWFREAFAEHFTTNR